MIFFIIRILDKRKEVLVGFSIGLRHLAQQKIVVRYFLHFAQQIRRFRLYPDQIAPTNRIELLIRIVSQLGNFIGRLFVRSIDLDTSVKYLLFERSIEFVADSADETIFLSGLHR